MYIAIWIMLGLVLMAVIFFRVSWSPTNARFAALTASLTATTQPSQEIFSEADIADLPTPVQKYFRYCGYIGTPKSSYAKVVYKDVDFLTGRGKPVLKIDHTQYNFVDAPNRIAYIDSSVYGIPFEGLDSYINGVGSMRGVVAKLYPLFNQTGPAMDKSSLVTYLAECLMVSPVALQDYITWEGMDDCHARATIKSYGMSVSGIFTFNDRGEMTSFVTDDREATGMDGAAEKVRWSIVCGEYQEMDGLLRPTVFKAIWHYEDGDLVYFDGKGIITDHI